MKVPTPKKEWKVKKIEAIANSGPLELRTVSTDGLKFAWAYVSRINPDSKIPIEDRRTDNDVATVACRTQDNKFMLTVQPRLPMHDFNLTKSIGKDVSDLNSKVPLVIEFPAGVIDKKGELPKKTSLRELSEETGTKGVKITSVSGRMPKSPGLTNESDYVTTCIFSEDKIGEKRLEPSEEIATFLATPEKFIKNVPKWEEEGFYVASGTYMYMKGWVDGKKNLCEEMIGKGVKMPEGMCRF